MTAPLPEAPEPGELHWRDRFEGMPERGRGAGLHLDEDERITIAHDEVDLALPTPPDALHESVATGQQVLFREPLPASAQVVFRRHEASLVQRGMQEKLPSETWKGRTPR